MELEFRRLSFLRNTFTHGNAGNIVAEDGHRFSLFSREKLQDKVTSLEDQGAKRNVESAVLVKKSQLVDDDTSSSDENANKRLQSGETLLEIEARVCDKTILIKIHYENRKGVLVKALSEIEKLHLSVINTSVMPFTSRRRDGDDRRDGGDCGDRCGGDAKKKIRD
ncbi:transcription factor bHLH18-like [Canna indica]|uniref:Transcription factor bHLH18-like n=1 Tax=Canna indica TaxID=4628 RepID=A0AAQ3JRZ1_9LILI|nr:transcription factor bHLH18-like [Canna indica]